MQVEDTLFTVHTYFLVAHSPVFKDMLQVAQANEGEGSSEDNPIILEDIPARDFDMLVRVLYTPYVEHHFVACQSQQIADHQSPT